MQKIQVLSQQIANQIAAGEVVERPASIVKELVENAIDAGATAITVEIQEGGVSYLRVTDNGSGIEADQVPVAFLRHATSKIARAEDLDQIQTLGFRGEALASIAAVAKVSLTTRTQQAESGTKIVIHGGEVLSCQPAACAGGTSIEVEDVFYNVPARRKFLKSQRAEAAAIGDLLSRIILAKPHISFRFLNSGKQVYQSTGDGQLKHAIHCVYGSDVLAQLRPVSYRYGQLEVSGFVGTEQLARPNRLHQSLFVNGRYIRSQRISFAVQRAFETRLMSGKFPFYVLDLSIPWEAVDVNVHPQKMEVRFRDEEQVFRAVTVATRMALGDNVAPLVRETDVSPFRKMVSHFPEEKKTGPTPGSAFSTMSVSALKELQGKLGIHTGAAESASISLGEPGAALGWKASVPLPPVNQAQVPLGEREGEAPAQEIPLVQGAEGQAALAQAPAQGEHTAQEAMDFGVEPYRVVGQLFECYWAVQQGDRVFFIDQHAAHERRLYESLMAGQLAGASQMLLLPIQVKLQPGLFALLLDNLSAFEELGFQLQEFGALTVRILAVPSFMGEGADAGDFLREALAYLERQGSVRATDLRRSTLIQMACKHAIKAGDRLAPDEIEALLAQYAAQGVPMTCPHGRPVMVQMTRLEFEKLFKRVL